MSKKDTKLVKVLTGGVLPVEPFLYGPVLTPYLETYDRIFKMVNSKVVVVEVLNDGTELQLDTANFDSDNNKASKKESKKDNKVEVQKEPVKETPEVVEEPKVLEEETEVVEPVEEDIIESVEKIQKPKQKNSKKK